MTLFKTLITNEDGATAVEYGLIASLVSVAIITVLQTLGVNLIGMFMDVAASVDITDN